MESARKRSSSSRRGSSMWWSETPRKIRVMIRLCAALVLAGLTAGCFQPLYGTQGPVGAVGIGNKLSSVEVAPIDAPNGTRLSRVGVEVRNSLMSVSYTHLRAH